MKVWKKLLILTFGFFVAFCVLLSQSNAEKNSGADELIVRAGIKKAKEIGFNPIPVYANEIGELIILPGTEFSIRNGRWALVNGDMIINVGKRPFPVDGIILNTGEYATIQNGKAEKHDPIK